MAMAFEQRQPIRNLKDLLPDICFTAIRVHLASRFHSEGTTSDLIEIGSHCSLYRSPSDTFVSERKRWIRRLRSGSFYLDSATSRNAVTGLSN
mmetsp:Transcript_1285/g.3792  ORF Transcript_1285/g.3792 Transcript_1285/m.3792 type:complete len:93 (-) Transcript_1285:5927-6205(-)